MTHTINSQLQKRQKRKLQESMVNDYEVATFFINPNMSSSVADSFQMALNKEARYYQSGSMQSQSPRMVTNIQIQKKKLERTSLEDTLDYASALHQHSSLDMKHHKLDNSHDELKLTKSLRLLDDSRAIDTSKTFSAQLTPAGAQARVLSQSKSSKLSNRQLEKDIQLQVPKSSISRLRQKKKGQDLEMGYSKKNLNWVDQMIHEGVLEKNQKVLDELKARDTKAKMRQHRDQFLRMTDDKMQFM